VLLHLVISSLEQFRFKQILPFEHRIKFRRDTPDLFELQLKELVDFFSNSKEELIFLPLLQY